MSVIQSTTLVVEGVEISVRYLYFPQVIGLMSFPNGDPGYPDEPAEVEIIGVCVKGVNITHLLDDSRIEQIADKIAKEEAGE